MVHTKFAVQFYKQTRKPLCHHDSTDLQIYLKQQESTTLLLYDNDNNLHNVIYLYMHICDIYPVRVVQPKLF